MQSLASWAADVYVAPYVWEIEQGGLVTSRGLSADGTERLRLPDQIPVPSVFRLYSLRDREGMPTLEIPLDNASTTLIYEHVVKQKVATGAGVHVTSYVEVLLAGLRRPGGGEDVHLVLPGGRHLQFESKADALRTFHELYT